MEGEAQHHQSTFLPSELLWEKMEIQAMVNVRMYSMNFMAQSPCSGVRRLSAEDGGLQDATFSHHSLRYHP